eukprot:Em0019g519a
MESGVATWTSMEEYYTNELNLIYHHCYAATRDIEKCNYVLKHFGPHPRGIFSTSTVNFPTHASFEEVDVIVAAWLNASCKELYGYQLKEGKRLPKKEAHVVFMKSFAIRGVAGINASVIRQWHSPSVQEIDAFFGESGSRLEVSHFFSLLDLSEGYPGHTHSQLVAVDSDNPPALSNSEVPEENTDKFPSLKLTTKHKLCPSCRVKLYKLPGEAVSIGSSEHYSGHDVTTTSTGEANMLPIVVSASESAAVFDIPGPATVEIATEAVAEITAEESSMQSESEYISGQDAISDIIAQLKEKIKCLVNRSEKAKLLTILPKSWSVRKIMKEFGAPDYMEKLLAIMDDNVVDSIQYQQWTQTDRSSLKTVVQPVEFLDEFMAVLKKLQYYDFIAKVQSNFILDIKNPGGSLQHKCYVIISEHTEHDTVAVHLFQRKLIQFLTETFTNVPNKIVYFSDGCSAQYKNRKNFINLCHHLEDFNVPAEWHFFATSHGKTAADGVAGTLKRLATKASLQHPDGNQILNAKQLFDFAVREIKGISFCYVTSNEHREEADLLRDRFDRSITIPGTQKFHNFKPIDTSTIEVKNYSTSSKAYKKRVSKL